MEKKTADTFQSLYEMKNRKLNASSNDERIQIWAEAVRFAKQRNVNPQQFSEIFDSANVYNRKHRDAMEYNHMEIFWNYDGELILED